MSTPTTRRQVQIGTCPNNHTIDVQPWAPKVPTRCPVATCREAIKLHNAR